MFSQAPANEESAVNLVYAFKWILATVTGTWAAFSTPVQVLGILMLGDYISGMLCAVVHGDWSYQQGWRGLIRKLLTVLLVYTCHCVSAAIKLPYDAGSAVAIACSINEFASILKNCANAGIYVPQVALDLLEKARRITADHKKAKRRRR